MYRESQKVSVKKHNSKWFKTFTALRDEIKGGNYNVGDRFLTIQDVCRKYDVSNITARRALSELSERDYIILKPKIGSMIKRCKNGKPSIAFWAPEDLKYKSGTVPIIFAKILEGLVNEANLRGVNIVYVNEHSYPNKSTAEIFICLYSYFGNLKEFLPSTSKILLHPPQKFPSHHNVRLNLSKGAYIATEYLIKKGYKKIGIMSGYLTDIWFLKRFHGYLDALKDNGYGFDSRLLKETSMDDPDEDIKAFEEMLALEDSPDAVFCCTDRAALNLIAYCTRKKIRIPEEIAICGFDGIYGRDASVPALTTVATKLSEIGSHGIKLALRLFEGEEIENQDIVLEPEMLAGDSA